jgi:hypothetical protein
MAQIFHPSADTWLRLAVAFVALAVLGGLVAIAGHADSQYTTRIGWVRDQPVPFSHAHHVGGLGIDCRYCHTTVETGPHAGLPATHVCMTCHSQEWTRAPVLEPVRRSYATGMPLRWNRVAKLPDYAYFNHSIHISRGVPCTTCHGRVDRMPLMARARPFEMKFCVDCHRDPLPQLVPPEHVADPEPMRWSPAEQHRFAADVARRFRIDPTRLDKCDICHR